MCWVVNEGRFHSWCPQRVRDAPPVPQTQTPISRENAIINYQSARSDGGDVRVYVSARPAERGERARREIQRRPVQTELPERSAASRGSCLQADGLARKGGDLFCTTAANLHDRAAEVVVRVRSGHVPVSSFFFFCWGGSSEEPHHVVPPGGAEQSREGRSFRWLVLSLRGW